MYGYVKEANITPLRLLLPLFSSLLRVTRHPLDCALSSAFARPKFFALASRPVLAFPFFSALRPRLRACVPQYDDPIAVAYPALGLGFSAHVSRGMISRFTGLSRPSVRRYVYKAQHKVTKEVVALKKIRMEGQQQGVCTCCFCRDVRGVCSARGCIHGGCGDCSVRCRKRRGRCGGFWSVASSLSPCNVVSFLLFNPQGALCAAVGVL